MPAFIHTQKDEARWERAKEKAEEAGFKENWAYITSIYKRMNGGKVASLRRIIIRWMGSKNERTMIDG